MIRSAKNKIVDVIAKGSVWLILGQAVSRIFSYVYKIIVARLGAAEFGIFSASMAVVETVSTIAALGLPMTVFFFIPHHEARDEKGCVGGIIRSALKLTLAASLVFAALLFMFADLIAVQLLHNKRIGIILKILALIIPIRNLRDTMVKALVGFRKVKYRVYARNMTDDGAKLMVTAALLYGGFGLMSAIYGYMAGLIASLAISVYLLEKRTFSFASCPSKSGEGQYRNILGYSIPLFLSGFVGYFLRWTDTFVLSYFRTMEEVGIYNVAVITASFITIFPEFFMTSAYPVIVSSFSAGREEESKRLVRIVNKWLLLCAVPAIALLAFFVREVVLLLFGKRYVDAMSCVLILLCGKMLWTIGSIGSRMLTMIRKNMLILYINVGLVAVNMVLAVIFVPRYGIIGAAAPTSFVLCVEFVLYMYLARKYFGIPLLPLKTGRILASGVIALAPFIYLKRAIPHQSLELLALEGCVYLLVYAATLWAAGVLTYDDLAVIRVAVEKVKDMKGKR